MAGRKKTTEPQLDLFTAHAPQPSAVSGHSTRTRVEDSDLLPVSAPQSPHPTTPAVGALALTHDSAAPTTTAQLPWLLSEDDRHPVQPARVLSEHRIAASRLPVNLRVGTSSWAFPGWQGIVFAGRNATDVLARDGLWAYARHPLLRTVGVDRTYYAPVTADVLRAYAAQVPVDFRFLVKVWEGVLSPTDGRSGESRRDFLSANVAVERCVRPFVDGLAEKGGVLLMQFPPLPLPTLGGVRATIALLDGFLAAMPADVPLAVEVRNRAFFCDEWFEVLARRHVVHCVNSHPTVPRVGEQAQWMQRYPQSRLVVRWMLAHDRTYSEARDEFAPFHQLVAPDDTTREELAELILSQVPTREMLVIINNKAEGSSPLSSFGLAQAVARRSPPPGAPGQGQARSTDGL